MSITQLLAGITICCGCVFPLFAAEKKNVTEAPKVAATNALAADNERVVARVNEKVITLRDLDASENSRIAHLFYQGKTIAPDQKARFRRDTLEDMISQELFLQEGRKLPIPDLKEKVTAQINAIKSRTGSEANFATQLKDSGMTEEDYFNLIRDRILVQEAIRKAVEGKVKIAAKEIKAFYESNRQQFQRQEQVKASHILIQIPANATDGVKKEKRALIDQARKRIVEGEKFEDVATELSEDPGSRQTGGDLGYFEKGIMVPEFETAAFSLKTNELSQVITTQFGYHILIVNDRRAAGEQAFDDVEPVIERFLKQRKENEVATQHAAELRKENQVEVLLPSMNEPVSVAPPPVQVPAP